MQLDIIRELWKSLREFLNGTIVLKHKLMEAKTH